MEDDLKNDKRVYSMKDLELAFLNAGGDKSDFISWKLEFERRSRDVGYNSGFIKGVRDTMDEVAEEKLFSAVNHGCGRRH